MSDHLPAGRLIHPVHALRPSSLMPYVNRGGIACLTAADFSIRRDGDYPYQVIHCVLSGQGRVSAGDRAFSVQAGDVFLLCDHKPHAYASDPACPMVLTWLEFAGGDCSRLMHHFVHHWGHVLSGAAAEGLTRLVSDFAGGLPGEHAPGSYAAGLSLYRLLCQAGSLLTRSGMPAGLPDALQRVLAVIHAHPEETHTMEALGRVAGHHPGYLSRLFHSHLGIPPGRYILQARVAMARQLLLETRLPPEIVAHQCGFCHLSHLTRHFRQLEGQTPAAFRREHQQMHQPR